MKIALNAMLLRPPFSGVERSIEHLARNLAVTAGEDIHCFVPRTYPGPDIEGIRFRMRRTVLPTRFRPVRLLWEHAILPRLLRREGFDLLHAPGYIAPLTPDVPVVVTLYDVMALRFPQWCKPANRFHYRHLLPRSACGAHGIIVPSRATRNDVLNLLPVSEARLRVIPLGIDEQFQPVRDPARLEQVRQALGLTPPFILFSGGHEPKKNLPGLLRALHRLEADGALRHTLVVVGGKGWPDHAARRVLRDHELSRRVCFTGFVSDRDLVALYTMADLFVFPSLYEGFGLPPLEAMACRTPVVCSNRGALPEVVGDAAVQVDPEAPHALADAIARALRDPGLRADLVKKGTQRAQHFSWPRTARATEAFYREVIHGEGRTP